MQDNPYREDRESIRELLQQFENLRNGRRPAFLEEESFEKIIDYFQEKEDLPKAREAVEMAMERYPFSAPLLVRKADLLLAERRYEEALEVLDGAMLLDSNDINVYILKTDAFLALDETAKAVQLLEEALAKFEGEERVDLLFELADVYDDYEDFDKVFDCLKLILEQEPTNEEALYKICFWTDFTGRNEESIRLHQQIIDEYPYSELAWFNLAAAYQGLKLYEKAIDAYQYAITIDEKFDYAYRNMGDAYIRLRKYREAIEVLQKVTELAKPEDVILEAIGHCYDRLKNFAQARFWYRKASHLRPDDHRLYYKLACTYFNEGSWEKAYRQLETALRMHPLTADYHLLAGECRMQQGRVTDAARYFAEVAALRPRQVSGWEALIRCLYKTSDWEQALEKTEAAIRVVGKPSLFHYYRAAILFAAGRNREALLQLEAAMELAPRLLKKFVELNPMILQNQQVVDLVARYKRNKSI